MIGATNPLFALDRAVAPGARYPHDAAGPSRAFVRDSVSNSADPARKAAVEFESVLLGQILDEMFAGLETDGPFSGGIVRRQRQ